MKHVWNNADICNISGLQAALNASFTVKTLTLENGTDRLSRNVRKKLLFYAAYNPKSA
jgi:hypothetical protein